MLSERYSIRGDFNLFKTHLLECQKDLYAANTLEKIITLQSNLQFLLFLCKTQSLYIVGQIKVCICLSGCINSLVNAKSEFIDNPKSSVILQEFKNVDLSLKQLLDAVSYKCDFASQSTEQNTESFNSLEEIRQHEKEGIENAARNKLYEDINERIEKETVRIQTAIDNHRLFVRGSVTVNTYVKRSDLKDIDHSIMKIPGISFNHARKENIAPIYVFHNQKLAVINIKRRNLTIGRNVTYQSNDEVFNEKFEKAESKSVGLIHQTGGFSTPYLMSSRFKNIRFLWFSENLPPFKSLKEKTVKLLV